jgi:hypothetical protein
MRMQRRSYGIRLKQPLGNRTASANCAVAAWRKEPFTSVFS